jgi:hypothetical protein
VDVVGVVKTRGYSGGIGIEKDSLGRGTRVRASPETDGRVTMTGRRHGRRAVAEPQLAEQKICIDIPHVACAPVASGALTISGPAWSLFWVPRASVGACRRFQATAEQRKA